MALPAGAKVAASLRPGDILVVIHDFDARSADELTLRKSERIELIELDDGFGDGWFLGKHLSRGGTGLFPGVYTTKAPSTVKPTPPTPANNRTSSLTNTNHHAVTTPAKAPTETSTSFPSPVKMPSQQQQQAQPSPPLPHSQSQQQQHRSSDTLVGSSNSKLQDSPRSSLPSPSSYGTFSPGVQRSIGEALSNHTGGEEESPVMTETLGVIDEHITDLSAPRQGLVPPQTIKEDSESEYSSHLERASYVAGPETDDEENDRLTETQVRQWDHKKTAQHLRSIGVEARHCDIFEQEEVNGEVLLDMDQGFIYMREFDFGPMGRRLKTWHKVRDFQSEVKSSHRISRKNTFSSTTGRSEATVSTEDVSRPEGRSISGGARLPRIPSLLDRPAQSLRHSQQPTSSLSRQTAAPAPLQPGLTRMSLGANTPPSPWRSSMIADSPTRASPALVRELTHSRRHSSIDLGAQPDLGLPASHQLVGSGPHKKQGSFDQSWSMSSSTAAGAPITPEQTSLHAKNEGLDLATNHAIKQRALSPDLDRGYFSGNEVDNRRQRGILRKRDSGVAAAHSHQSSTNATNSKRHSRLASAESVREAASALGSAASRAYHSAGYKGRFRSASARSSVSRVLPGALSPPTVTNLENESSTSRTASGFVSMQNRAKKLIGMRATSDNVAASEKVSIEKTDKISETSVKASPVNSPTGDSTPSQNSRSLDIDGSENSSRIGEMPLPPLPRAPARTKAKTKQETSAYTRGLLKISPQEARKMCDHHGWMKKKSSSLMTTWKPRLFILRGRRLSYYYSENDTEERGVIDISGHKVLVANSDAMITLHAQITRAASSASPPAASVPSSTEASPTLSRSPETGSTSLFYFKLVPPKSGMARAVQFTKPAIHFFQVDSIEAGRKWMGEIMKATIEHDLRSFETTNKQKTISLAMARARKERPPELQGSEAEKDVAEDLSENKENIGNGGLNITGLDDAKEGETTVKASDEDMNKIPNVDESVEKADSGTGTT